VPVKESSDELNPDEITNEPIVSDHGVVRSPADHFALAIATCGVGFIPLAPGTWGSLVGVGIFFAFVYLFSGVFHSVGPFVVGYFVLTGAITFVGIWAASRTEQLLRRKDPGKVVVDEVAGQLVSMVPLIVFLAWPRKVAVIISFLLFRFFDIVKPYPARRFEGLHGGLGIMADDLVAGVYAAVLTTLLMWGYLRLF
jgi:phosphatidylglycerophosphatase A